MDRQGDALRRLGRRLTQLREQQRLTMEAIAGLTGIGVAELAKIEAGEVDIQLTTIVLLAQALGIPPNQFLAGL